MKNKCLIIILVFTGQLAFSQSVEANLIKYKGLAFSATKAEIISRLGKPESIYYPNYECGFLTPLPDEENYFTLDYGRVKFTGNETEGLVLELVDFEKDSLSVLKYGLNELSYKTSLIELVEIFGSGLADNLIDKNNGSVVIYFLNSDDGIRLEVKNGKLIKFEYWSPC